jgi:lysozyme family protein
MIKRALSINGDREAGSIITKPATPPEEPEPKNEPKPKGEQLMPTATKDKSPAELAIDRLIDKVEGGYSNDPDDTGGETMYGISRVYNPDWPGWMLVDAAKTGGAAIVYDEVYRLARDFYIDTRWNAFNGDAIAEVEPELAFQLLELSTHSIPSTAVRYLQIGLNALNYNAKTDGNLYPDVKVDGAMGDKTVDAVRALKAKGDTRYLIETIEIQQGMYYLNHAQKKYMRGFLNRVGVA